VGELQLGGVTNIVARDFVHMQNVEQFNALRKMALSRRLAAPVILLDRDGKIPRDLGLPTRALAKLL